MKTILNLFFVLLLTSYGCVEENSNSQEIVTTISTQCEALDTLEYLSKYTYLPSSAAGYSGKPSPHWGATQWFRSKLDNSTALSLINHENKLIRILASEKVLSKRDLTAFQLLESSAKDTTTYLNISYGCTTFEEPLFTYFLNRVNYPSCIDNGQSAWTVEQKVIIQKLAEKSSYFEFYPEMKEMNQDHNAKQ